MTRRRGVVDAAGSIEVEVVEGLPGGKVREPEPAGQAPRVGRGDLDAQQMLEGSKCGTESSASSSATTAGSRASSRPRPMPRIG